MTQRTNLITKHNPIKYILGSILLLAISGAGIVWIKEDKKDNMVEEEVVTITPTTVAPTVKLVESYESLDDGFTVKYDSKRKLVIENEESGKRYVFSNYSGNFTVHVGNRWSWISSERIFSDNLLIDGEKSYVYEISSQKIIDMERGDKKYTIQCIHNGKEELKTECQKFLENFEFI
jgi:hypothetical protein